MANLVVEKSQVVLVKPSKPTPHVTLSLSTIDNDPYIEALTKTIYVYRSSQNIHDPASLLQQALSNVLVYYYPLAGKLNRRSHDQRLVAERLELSCTAADGVPFIKATAASTLSSLNYLEGTDDLDAVYQLVPDYDVVRDCSSGYDPLALQVTKFSCGGLTIGMALSHSVCDGFGASKFFRALSELASGKTHPTTIPVWDRHILTYNNFNFNGQVSDDSQAPERNDFVEACASVAASPYTSEDMVTYILNITSKDITKLKKKITEEDKNIIVTTLEILAAQVWKARCKALKLNPSGTTLFGLAIGIRHVLEPRLPEGYYGNAFVKAHVGIKARELNDLSLSRVVKLIKDAKMVGMEKKYLWEQLRDTEKMMKKKIDFEGGKGAFMLLTDWRQLGLLEEIDFGFGSSVNIVPVMPKNLPDICVFLPAAKVRPEMKGGVRVLVTLPRIAVDNFMKEMNLLNSLV